MASRNNILVVEDDKLLSDLLLRKLGGSSYYVMHARTGEEALEILKDNKPDVILLDILLPGVDGFEVLRQVKSSPILKQIPVIVLSNLGQESDLEKGKELGAKKFLIKATLTLDDVVRTIESELSAQSEEMPAETDSKALRDSA
ncbi:response regulator [Candidatus Kaiserbacteria bacterium CG10_big_fil_rev_8_21_14_0_10_49_17]|uniref:Response regulator n=1 Tax=Candidatus Kaiserbacteria bacterium CG10_big_fil_rev_8_21_14_0_10_49_17 TaxID=1974609 RepID=A0A2M6WF70_9BACT|nr:MAG: response regulator [Candidatus Kaiserbacteria bacterium CG10_big_fil_rev_8_21_14_0_10_49_17]